MLWMKCNGPTCDKEAGPFGPNDDLDDAKGLVGWFGLATRMFAPPEDDEDEAMMVGPFSMTPPKSQSQQHGTFCSWACARAWLVTRI